MVQMDNNSESAARCKRQLTQTTGCFLIPEATEGPYYWNSTIRQNITEGKPGIPFRLSIAVIDTNNCTPLVKALVDLWHCDADGIYSHYIAASQGISGAGNDNQTFFRGLMLTDANGIAVFDTIYPGWYLGRATHIHVKVHVGMNITSNSSGTYSGGHVSHTGQLFFNDTLTDLVALISPYSNHTITRTLNSEDSIYASANGSVTLVLVTQNSANNYTGIVTLGVNSTAIPDAVDAGGMGPGMGQIPPNSNNFSMGMPSNSNNFSMGMPPNSNNFSMGMPPNPNNFSIGMPSNSNNFSMGMPPNSNNFSMGMPPNSNNFSMGMPPNPNNFSMGMPSNSNNFSMGMPSNPNNFSIGMPSNSNNFSMGMPPNSNNFSMGMPSNSNNFSMAMPSMTFATVTIKPIQGAAATFCISLSTILFVLLLHIKTIYFK